MGILCTSAFAILFVALHPLMGAQSANFVAMGLAAILNTALNRSYTFGLRHSHRLGLHHIQGLVLFAFGWGLTAFALAMLHLSDSTPSRAAELTTVLTVNLIGTATRFFVFRWAFVRPPAAVSAPVTPARPGS